MKQTSEPAVQPRRNLLTALWVWAVGLWGSSNLLAATTCAEKPSPAPQSCDDTLKQHAFALLVGRLCLDANFRKQFFGKTSGDEAKALLERADIAMPTKKEMEGAEGWMAKMLKARKSPENPVEDAFYTVDRALSDALKPSTPCIPWPC